MPDENSRRHIEHAVVRIQLLNRGTTAGRVPLAKDLLKVAVQEFVNSFRHSPSPWLISNGAFALIVAARQLQSRCARSSAPAPSGQSSRILILRCRGSNPPASASQSVSNAYGIGSRSKWREMAAFRIRAG